MGSGTSKRKEERVSPANRQAMEATETLLAALKIPRKKGESEERAGPGEALQVATASRAVDEDHASRGRGLPVAFRAEETVTSTQLQLATHSMVTVSQQAVAM